MKPTDDTTTRVAEGESATEATTARPAGKPPAAKGLGVLGWLRWFWRTLTAMRTALILLFLFALGSVPGSLFPQTGVSPAAVARYFEEDPVLAEWLDRFWLFDVFQAPWFAAIYLLLFVSLVGCILPRTRVYLRELRREPPAAPRNLSRLPHSGSFETDAETDSKTEAATTVEEVAATLRRRRFRVVTGPGWVAGEKGYLREAGNLLFHTSLVGLLIAVGVGALYGYRGNVIIIEGNGFANTVAAYDRYIPGSQVSAESLEPFSFRLDDFKVDYQISGDRPGQVLDYTGRLKVNDSPTAPERDYTLKVNHPLEVNGTQTYLIDHGYAPTFTVTDGKGDVAFEGPVVCLPQNNRNFASECTIKVPDAKPEQLGLAIRFLPTAVQLQDGSWDSTFPSAINPIVQVTAFAGDLGLRTGVPQSVYLFDQERLKKMKRLVMMSDPVELGKSLDLPGGYGKVTFTGVKEWAALQIAYDPGRLPALLSSVGAVLGIVLSLLIRRRRVWVRVTEREDGGKLVQAGGLTRTESADGGFADEFADIVAALKGRSDDAR
ncbi:cytochrome c biogenesis protein ResB [Spongiactinospora sp. TRM90649]|uniref:cytochrome c biogenesis protein ResB n=1 Tax=Spongiactinospora sp. TRM90649 TaxID=3031114 RepID=UPI0023F994C2|nr:cytochrome c biogenesis protein ResB [Spongiactinospora sp. TRM90649]MDF5754953.1 cytochrome c biogenesis protein ResB [Spongiactinospora sp. TRM90649]